MTNKPKKPEFIPVNEDDLQPGHRWHRPLQAPGTTQVDFEERVDFRRLHRYRLARTRQQLAQSGLGAVLCFEQSNIRYISSTVIGEWARDKLLRYCLLTGPGDPWVWDMGSAVLHHKLNCPWLREDHMLPGNPGMRGAIEPEVGLFKQAAKEIKELLGLRAKPGAKSATVRDRASAKLTDIDEKIRSLRAMRKALAKLVESCSGRDPVESCSILESLASSTGRWI